MERNELVSAVVMALENNGGSASIVEVCKYIWGNYEKELLASGDLFFTWQYDVRWAATHLRNNGVMVDAKESPKGVWELNNN